jgi:Golgi SNAP receptor complex protein 2
MTSSADIQSVYSQARKLALTVGASVTALERDKHVVSGAEEHNKKLRSAENQLGQLQRICQDLEAQYALLSATGSSKPKESLVWQRKVHQVIEETDSLQISLNACRSTFARMGQEEAQRQELLQRRRNIGAASNGVIDVETADMEAKERIKRSKMVAEEAYQTGVATLSAMAGQRDVLKSAHRKVLDVLNTVGMSDSVLRIAERRIRIDKIIAYGGMLVITILVVVWLAFYGQ